MTIESPSSLAESPLMSSTRIGTLRALGRYLLYGFCAITAVAVFLPLNPRMPASGLDASWEFAMNEGVAHNLAFGRDIVFTYGPYASMATRLYHPAVERRMMAGSILLLLSYVTALQLLSRGSKLHLAAGLLILFATFPSAELLFFSYSFLLVLCILAELQSRRPAIDEFGWIRAVTYVFLWSTLGFLPLVKGSLLLPFLTSLVLSSGVLLLHGRKLLAVLALVVPQLSMIGLWVLAGQKVEDFASYLRGTLELTFGYTEAMSTTWVVIPQVIGAGFVIAYLMVTLVILTSSRRAPLASPSSRWTLTGLSIAFLFVIFKHGFVAVGNVSGLFASVSALIILFGFLHFDRFLKWALAGTLSITILTSVMHDPLLLEEVHQRFGVGALNGADGSRRDILMFCARRAAGGYMRTTFGSTLRAYAESWEGSQLRVGPGNRLAERYAQALKRIRTSSPIPALEGSADFYEYDQSLVLASGNQWNPRPVIQSYSAYTPYLTRLNELHLRGDDAPTWVLFTLQTIDGRLPSLDDGESWPALLDNYSLTSNVDKNVILRRRVATSAASQYADVSIQTCKAGEKIAVQEQPGIWFAQVDWRPTIAGKILSEVFNQPQLRIVLSLSDGSTKSFRVVSEMMETGFLLSPLVESSEQFASLQTMDLQNAGKRVTAMTLKPTYGGSLFWNSSYRLTLKRYIRN